MLERSQDISPSSEAVAWYIRAIERIGIPAIIAGVLMWLMLSGLPATVQANRVDLLKVQADLAIHAARANDAYASLTRILQQICVNTATSNAERAGCFP